jgi:prepilin-type N-terminal cleavage/methylation domain-containing protein
MSFRNAFTLVELLIVVVILGILAAVVVPQFTNATNEATSSNIKSQLQSLQKQIDLYMARNSGVHPITTMAQSWSLLISQGYLKAAPINPAQPAGPVGPTTVGVQSTAGQRGASGWAWVWNSADVAIYASYFNETTGQVTSSASD